MVAHRSPKPLVWVRILLPLPKEFETILQTLFSFLLNFNKNKEVIINKFIFIYIFILCITVFYSSIIYFHQNTTYINQEVSNDNNFYFSSDFLWPVPGFHTITCPFGPRKSPTSGASSNHSGIDIGAPEGTVIYSSSPGTVSFTGFNGANGCSIIIDYEEFSFSYCHVSPDFIVSKGDKIFANQEIGKVGPKILYGISNNPYKDSNGNPTNGATTGCHLHFGIKKDGIAVNPLDYFN